METRMEVTISPDMHESPYLKAIQSVNGQSPGEKYKHLNAFTQSIVKICRETGVSSGDVIRARQQEISAALLPLVRILTGIELKSTEAVVEALKSTDITVVNKALHAKWFFDGSNSHVDTPFFMENIIPFVSVRTRMDIVKALTRGLYDSKEKAENFFNLFYNMFGLEQAMPFLPYCSEEFLYATILKFKIVLSFKMLDSIFQRYPNVAIRYLYLGCEGFDPNESDRKIHTIDLSTYANFLPKLIKKHVHDYITLLPCVGNTCSKIGSTRTRALFKNASEIVMKSPEKFNRKWPLKYIYHRVPKQQFEEYYAAKQSKSYWDYNFMEMFTYLKYYPKDSRIDFMKNQYESFYKRDFFQNLQGKVGLSEIANLFNNGQINEEEFEKLYSKTFDRYQYRQKLDDQVLNLKNYTNDKMLKLLHRNMKEKNYDDFFGADSELIKKYYSSEKYLLLLSNEEKLKHAQHLISFYKKGIDSSSYYKWCCFLSVEQSFDIFKSGAECSDAQKRTDFLKKMIYSCKIYNDQNHLTKVLKYYIHRHINEQSSTLHSILEYLLDQFDILSLHDTNWQLFCEILETAYIKNELFNGPVDMLNKIFEISMHRLSIQSTQEMQEREVISLNAVIHKYLEFKIAFRDDTDWTVFESSPDLEEVFIKLLISNIPIKYPENHSIWMEDNKKVKVGLKIISKLHKYNQKIIKTLDPQERNTANLNTKIIRVTSYTWVKEISEYLLREPDSKNSKYLESFKALMKTFDEEFYLSLISIRENPHKNILSGKAAKSLKNNCTSILNDWEEYFNTARNMLRTNSQSGAQAAKQFIISTKWHQELPLRFVDRCVAEIDKPGSLIILALLVDGDTLSKFLSNYIPSGPIVDIHKKNAKEEYQIISFIPSAINVSVPFVSTEILMSMLQRDYIKLGHRSVRNFGQRVNKPAVLNFAKQLVDKPVSVQKHGIRLMFSVFTVDEIIEFISKLSDSKHHPTINMVITHRIFYLFTKYPNDQTWNLINNFMDSLRCNDLLAFKILTNTKLVCNPYASLYFKKLLSKIEDLNEPSEQMETDQVMEVDEEKSWTVNKEHSLKEKLIKAAFENVSEKSATFLTKEIIIDILRKYYFGAKTKILSQSSRKFADKIFSQPFIGRNLIHDSSLTINA